MYFKFHLTNVTYLIGVNFSEVSHTSKRPPLAHFSPNEVSVYFLAMISINLYEEKNQFARIVASGEKGQWERRAATGTGNFLKPRPARSPQKGHEAGAFERGTGGGTVTGTGNFSRTAKKVNAAG
jgi:hypothetical protein